MCPGVEGDQVAHVAGAQQVIGNVPAQPIGRVVVGHPEHPFVSSMLPGGLVEDTDLAQVFPDLVVPATAVLVYGGGLAPVRQTTLAVLGY